MSKRATGQQLTRENYGHDSDDDGITDPTILATSEQMSKRKIAMPKRKIKFSSSNTANQESTFANSFSSIINKNVPISTNSKSEENNKLVALNQQFKDKIVSVISSDPCIDLSSIIEKYKHYVKSILKAESTTSSVTLPTMATENKPTNPFANTKFKPSTTIPTATPVTTVQSAFKMPESSTTTTKEDVKMDDSSDESESDSDVKIEGPQFTINSNPIKSDSVFSFGEKKVEAKNESESESDIEIKGPSFNFTGTIKDNVFKLKKDEPQLPLKFTNTFSSEKNKDIVENETSKSVGEQEKDNSKPAFSFGQISTANDNKSKKEPVESTFTFSSSTIANTEQKKEQSKPSSVFTFGKPAENKETTTEPKEQAKLTFSFGQNVTKNKGDGKTDTPKSQFALGTTAGAPEKTTEASKSVFTFGTTSNKTEATTEISKPAFSFTPSLAAVEDTNKNSKPSFTFGAAKTSTVDNTEVTKKPFTFGNSVVSTEPLTEAKKPVFSFGTSNSLNSAEKSETPKSSFSFGASVTASTNGEKTKDQTSQENPKFSFNISDSSVEKPTAAPSFSFGKPATTADNEKSSETKSAFSFGANTGSATSAPSFSFGNAQTNELKAVPSGGFKFSLPFEQKVTSSSTDTPETKTVAGKSQITESTENTEKQEESEGSKAIDMQNGEEDEKVLFSQRSKLMIFNTETKAYDSKGVGEMKLLQKKDDSSKVRLLCRSDGMGNILLNTNVVKSFKYTSLSETAENLVKTPVIDAASNFVTYVVKFKQKSDGRAFIKAIEDSKKDM